MAEVNNRMPDSGAFGLLHVSGGKQGVLFTVSVLLLSISLLSFAIYLSEQTAASRHTAVSLLEIDRTMDTYADIENELVKILMNSLNVTVENSTVFLNASLPMRPGAEEDFERFRLFEKNYSDLGVEMNLTSLKAGSLLIQPGEIAILNSQSDLNITPKDSLESAGGVVSYDFSLTFQPMGADSASWVALSDSSASQVQVHIRVQDASYSFIYDTVQSVDKYNYSLLKITQGGAEVGFVEFYPPSSARIHYGSNIGLKASIGLSNPVYVEANDTISVRSAANKTGRVRIA